MEGEAGVKGARKCATSQFSRCHAEATHAEATPTAAVFGLQSSRRLILLQGFWLFISGLPRRKLKARRLVCCTGSRSLHHHPPFRVRRPLVSMRSPIVLFFVLLASAAAALSSQGHIVGGLHNRDTVKSPTKLKLATRAQIVRRARNLQGPTRIKKRQASPVPPAFGSCPGFTNEGFAMCTCFPLSRWSILSPTGRDHRRRPRQPRVECKSPPSFSRTSLTRSLMAARDILPQFRGGVLQLLRSV